MARPGHYISMPPDATQADMLIPLMKPGVAGLQKWWDTPTGSYKIDHAFDVIAAHPDI